METINKTTKRGQRFTNDYERSNMYDLYDCYERFSCKKACAERECKQMMYNEGGRGFKIISANTFQFTCGWMTPEGLRVETACGSYIVK